MPSPTETPEVEEAQRRDTGRQAPGRFEIAEEIAWLYLDEPGKKVNTLSTRLFDWFEEQVSRLESEKLRGLVILSDKPGTFVAGADIEELKGLSDRPSILAMLERGHALLRRLQALPYPVVAAIHGACLGGGLELALACNLRVATDDSKTRLGLPEVRLGLIPGLGGTQRLPRLIGVPAALDLILTGKQIPARRARRLGLVHEVCHPAQLREVARRLAAGDERPAKAKKPLPQRLTDLLARLPVAKSLVYGKARSEVQKRTGGHYPAPLRAVEVVKTGMGRSLEKALQVESQAFADLVVTDTAKSLMTVFFSKNDVERRAAGLARESRPVEKVGVLGAGFMGAGIAQLLSYKGLPVVLKDKDTEALERGMKQVGELFGELVKRRRLREPQLKEAMARVVGTLDYEPFQAVSFVIEAVFEDLDVKHRVIRELEEAAPAELILASNTSTIPIARLAEASRRPQQVVGMHFFSPVHKMPLLEVIRHPGTSEEAVATTVAVGQRMGKTIIVVNDGPGFFTSRVLGPFVNEAAWILTQGARIEEIDRALTRWGWPVGPLALLDEVGLDIAHHAAQVMVQHLGERVAAPPALDRMIEDGRLGRKAGRGFYTYGKGSKKPDEEVYALIDWQAAPVDAEEIVERCWMQMLNETAYCIQEGVIENPVDVDLGVVFGFGFPPFRGGLLREADRVGPERIVARLEHYAARHGRRLAPAPLLREMAERGERFYKD